MTLPAKRCPECGREYTPLNDKQELWCNGGRTMTKVGHKLRKMVDKQ